MYTFIKEIFIFCGIIGGLSGFFKMIKNIIIKREEIQMLFHGYFGPMEYEIIDRETGKKITDFKNQNQKYRFSHRIILFLVELIELL